MRSNIAGYSLTCILLSMPLFTGCLALSFGGKTEMSQPVDMDRISKLEARMQNVEKYVGIQTQPENLRYATLHDGQISE